MLKHPNDIWFVRLGGDIIIFINTGIKLRYSVFKNIYVEIGIKAVNCKKPVQLKAAFCVTEHSQ
jgi:hypothetical protein